MAGEEIFAAAAIQTVGALLVFLTLYVFAKREKNGMWEQIWLFSIFMTMVYSFTVQRVGFNATGLFDLRDLAFSVLEVNMWIAVAIAAAIGVNLLLAMLRGLYNAAMGKNEYKEE